jgi:hypothetical protein
LRSTTPTIVCAFRQLWKKGHRSTRQDSKTPTRIGTNQPQQSTRRVCQFLRDAANFVFHRLLTVDTSSESHAGGDSWHSRSMQGFMTLFHGGEDSVPIALDVGTVRVKVRLEPCRRKDTLTNCDLLGNRDSDAHRNDAQICNNLHSPIVIANNGEGQDDS